MKKLFIVLPLFIVIFLALLIYLSTSMSDKNKFLKAIKNNSDKIETEKVSLLSTAVNSNLEKTSENPYQVHKKIYATMFWVGEDSSDENDYIPNKTSAWDIDWMNNFGGIDNPYKREGFYPESFKPKENPFYIALPYTEYDDLGLKTNASKIPWYSEYIPETSLLKNRWVKITYENKICYGQWEDVGPFEDDDVDYVFGTNSPKNKRAGIDLSPALRTCLKMATNDYVEWQFIDAKFVPEGPWKEIITTTQINW